MGSDVPTDLCLVAAGGSTQVAAAPELGLDLSSTGLLAATSPSRCRGAVACHGGVACSTPRRLAFMPQAAGPNERGAEAHKLGCEKDWGRAAAAASAASSRAMGTSSSPREGEPPTEQGCGDDDCSIDWGETPGSSSKGEESDGSAASNAVEEGDYCDQDECVFDWGDDEEETEEKAVAQEAT
jgi:hypothetical protein